MTAHMLPSQFKRRRPWFISRVEQGPDHNAVVRNGRPFLEAADSC